MVMAAATAAEAGVAVDAVVAAAVVAVVVAGAAADAAVAAAAAAGACRGAVAGLGAEQARYSRALMTRIVMTGPSLVRSSTFVGRFYAPLNLSVF